MLKHVGEPFQSQAFPADKTQLPQDSITIPIEFNPWRYEREAEMIVPLLRTTEQIVSEALTQYEGADAQGKPNPTVTSKMASALKNAARFCLVAGVSLASAIKFKTSIPGVGDIELSPKDAIAETKSLLDAPLTKAKEADGRKNRDHLAEMSAVYYDFERKLSAITGRGRGAASDGVRINLLFLVDDIDRCLPEKAVEMLETIKLFLDVPGCAFLLAVDDEVVERGILHRYRDYLLSNAGSNGDLPSRGSQLRPPITGAEYLEKIIHIPLRLPLPTERELRALLIARYPALFAEEQEPSEPSRDQVRKEGSIGSRTATIRSSSPSEATRLLDLFVTATPPVPRKLIRAAELFQLYRDVAIARGWSNPSPLVLARVLLLQLFAPDLYRYGRRQPAFLASLKGYDDGYANEWDLPSFDIPNNKREKRVYELIDTPLIKLLKEQASNRNGFRIQRLFDERWPLNDSDLQGVARYFSLFEESVTTSSTLPIEEEARPLAHIDSISDFVALLSSDRPDAWRSALEPIAGSWILESALTALIVQVNELEKVPAEKRRSPLDAVDWLELLANHLSAIQLRRFYRETELPIRLSRRQGIAP